MAAWLRCGKCVGEILWPADAGHVRVHQSGAKLLELPSASAPWVRVFVGGRKAKAKAKSNARLLLIAHQGQIGVEDVARPLHLAGIGVLHDADHHLGIGEAGHGAIGVAAHFLRQEHATIAA